MAPIHWLGSGRAAWSLTSSCWEKYGEPAIERHEVLSPRVKERAETRLTESWTAECRLLSPDKTSKIGRAWKRRRSRFLIASGMLACAVREDVVSGWPVRGMAGWRGEESHDELVTLPVHY